MNQVGSNIPGFGHFTKFVDDWAWMVTKDLAPLLSLLAEVDALKKLLYVKDDDFDEKSSR